MSLSAPTWTLTLQGIMAGLGMVGPDVPKFAGAIGDGSVKSVSGKSFGIIGTKAPGVGVGLVGIAPSSISNLIISNLSAVFGGGGYALPLLAQAIELAMISSLGLATLKGTASGAIVPGSVTVNGAEWGGNILDAGVGRGFMGPQWPATANAIGAACATGMLQATGLVNGGGDPGAGAGTVL